MKKKSRIIIISLFFSICFLFAAFTNVSSKEYVSLKGLKLAKAVFDFKIGDPKSAAAHLKLIHKTFKDKSITALANKPDFVVVFIGHSAKIVSKNRAAFSPEEQKILEEIASIISEMSKDGIKLEICLFAAEALGVDSASILPEIKHVGNGWVSLIGYQANGYSLVPAY
jgi:intracellular sulfur oxidation DsrE/DsrF family protein